MSTNPSQIASLDDIGKRSSVAPVTAWLPGTDTTATVTGLSPGTTYYFNVVVQDSVHNMAAYGTACYLSGTSATVMQSRLPQSASYNFSLDIGSTARHVYLIFTNTGTSRQSTPAIGGFSYAPGATVQPQTAQTGSSVQPSVVPNAVSEFLRKPAAMGSPRALAATPTAPQSSYTVGVSSRTFFDENGNTVTATLQKQTTFGSETLNIWVDSSATVTTTQLDAVAAAFLDGTDTKDIYHWETSMYGAPWGPTPYSNLIPDDHTVNILFTPMGSGSSGTVVGFFYGRDNYVRTINTGSATDSSNEMIMFYMNSSVYSDYPTTQPNTNGKTEGENLIISTLAHEFQHMIQFYQKTILLAGSQGTDTWINEMMSMMTEDVLAQKLGLDGPRGVWPATDGSAGSAGNSNGRLPLFDYLDDVSLTNWGGYSLLASYSDAYSFGAYLLRNFGGAGLLHDMMHNGYTDEQALMAPLAARGYSLSFGELLSQWAASVLLSDLTDTPSYYRYNTGGWLPSSYGGYSYDVGSIDMFNYLYSSTTPSQSGPYLYGSNPIGRLGYQPPASNQFVDLGNLSGLITRTFSVGADNRLTVVLK